MSDRQRLRVRPQGRDHPTPWMRRRRRRLSSVAGGPLSGVTTLFTSPTAIQAETSCYLARTPGPGRDQTLEGSCAVS